LRRDPEPVGRVLSADDVEDLLLGGAVLGCGGGGPLWAARQFADALRRLAQPVRLVQVQDVPDDAWVGASAMTALPTAVPGGAPFPWEPAVSAFSALSAALPDRLGHVAPVAPGGANIVVPLLVAARLGLPVVDASGAPRAGPFFGGYLYAYAKSPRLGTAAVAGLSNVQVLDAPSPMALQGIVQQLMGPVLGGVAGVALWPMRGDALEDACVLSPLTAAMSLGRLIRAERAHGDPVAAVARRLDATVLFRAGSVAPRASSTGDAVNAFVSLDGRRTLLVHHLGETLLVWLAGEPGPMAMGPDSIFYLTADGHPFGNDPTDLARVAGKELVILAARAPASYALPPIVATWAGGIAATTGYAGAYVAPKTPVRVEGAPPPEPTRDELWHLLTEAAELEHLIMGQYLYTAFSLKQGEAEGLTWEQAMHTRNWAQLLLLLARQEMEHLGLVSNLLTAVGGAPHFMHPGYPQSLRYFEEPFELRPFSQSMLKRFICFERPENVPPEDAFCGRLGRDRVRALRHGEFSGEPEEGLAALYGRIRWLIQNLPLTDAELFVGPPNAQIDGNILHVNFPRPGALGGIFDVTLFDIGDRVTALQAIDLIVEQGEGGSGAEEFTHYRWLREIHEDYERLCAEDPAFRPARPLVANPVLYQTADTSRPGTLITHPAARDVMALWNGAYELLLLLLYRLYASGADTQSHTTALVYTMFPLMTQVIRPIAEILTSLPAFERPTQERAGPSFQLSGVVHLLPNTDAAFVVLREKLAGLAADAQRLGARADLPPRLAYIGQNLAIMAGKFGMIAAGTYPPDLLVPGVAHFYTPPTQS
jgi:DUF917 family protein